MNLAKAKAGDNRLVRAVVRHFGTWDAGQKAAGLNVRRERAPLWTQHALVKALRTWAKGVTSPTAKRLHDDNPPLARALNRHFGGFLPAARAAGIDSQNMAIKWTRQRVLDLIRAHQESSLTSDVLKRLRWAATKHFGTWPAAKAAAAGIGQRAPKERRDR